MNSFAYIHYIIFMACILFLSIPQSEIVQPFLKSLRNHPIPNLNNESVMSIIPDIENTEQVSYKLLYYILDSVFCLSSCISLCYQVFTFPLPNPRRLPEIPTDVSAL